MKANRKFAYLALLVVLSMILTACAVPATTTTAPAAGAR